MDEKKIPKVRDEIVLAAIIVWNFYMVNRLAPYIPQSMPVQLTMGGRIPGHIAKSWWSINIYGLAALVLFVIFSSIIWIGRRSLDDDLPTGNSAVSATSFDEWAQGTVKVALNGCRFINAAAVVLLSYVGYARMQVIIGNWQGLGIAFWVFFIFLVVGITLLMGQILWLFLNRPVRSNTSD